MRLFALFRQAICATKLRLGPNPRNNITRSKVSILSMDKLGMDILLAKDELRWCHGVSLWLLARDAPIWCH